MEFGKNENIEEVNTPFGAIHIVYGRTKERKRFIHHGNHEKFLFVRSD